MTINKGGRKKFKKIELLCCLKASILFSGFSFHEENVALHVMLPSQRLGIMYMQGFNVKAFNKLPSNHYNMSSVTHATAVKAAKKSIKVLKPSE